MFSYNTIGLVLIFLTIVNCIFSLYSFYTCPPTTVCIPSTVLCEEVSCKRVILYYRVCWRTEIQHWQPKTDTQTDGRLDGKTLHIVLFCNLMLLDLFKCMLSFSINFALRRSWLDFATWFAAIKSLQITSCDQI